MEGQGQISDLGPSADEVNNNTCAGERRAARTQSPGPWQLVPSSAELLAGVRKMTPDVRGLSSPRSDTRGPSPGQPGEVHDGRAPGGSSGPPEAGQHLHFPSDCPASLQHLSRIRRYLLPVQVRPRWHPARYLPPRSGLHLLWLPREEAGRGSAGSCLPRSALIINSAPWLSWKGRQNQRVQGERAC